MAKIKRCKNCKSAISTDVHKIDNYTITISRCKCGWQLIDVIDNAGISLKTVLPKDVIERMLRSSASHLTF